MNPVKVLHISDLHIESKPAKLYPIVPQSLDGISAQIRASKPDMVIVTGDLTCHGSCDREELEMAKAWLDGLGLPYMAIAGNHDLGPNSRRAKQHPGSECYDPHPFDTTHFARVFGTGVVESLDIGPCQIIGLNIRNGDPDNALALLENQLSAAKKPVIVFGHYPVVPVRDHGVLATFGFSDYIPDSVSQLRQLLTSHLQVKIYACGHVHVNSATPITRHCLQMSAGALGPGSSTYRSLVIDADGISYQTLFGGGPLGFWEHVAPGFDEPPEYQLGSIDERMGSISF